MNPWMISGVLMVIVIVPLSLLQIGYIDRRQNNYERGKHDRAGLEATPFPTEKMYQYRMNWARILILLGIWYMLGWYSAGEKDYDLGWKAGTSPELRKLLESAQ